MAWFILARLLFTVAVAYTAFQLRPVGPDPLVNVLFGLASPASPFCSNGCCAISR